MRTEGWVDIEISQLDNTANVRPVFREDKFWFDKTRLEDAQHSQPGDDLRDRYDDSIYNRPYDRIADKEPRRTSIVEALGNPEEDARSYYSPYRDHCDWSEVSVAA